MNRWTHELIDGEKNWYTDRWIDRWIGELKDK